jgi:hypothetical protein
VAVQWGITITPEASMTEQPKKCVECGGATRPIRVVDAGHYNMHHHLSYAAVGAEQGWFTGQFPVQGHLAAEMCEACGRVAFRAVPVKA